MNEEFNNKLIAALQLMAADKEEKKNLIPAALALRSWYRHAVLQDKPELVRKATADILEVYGDSSVHRAADGTVKVLLAGQPIAGYLQIAHLTKVLAESARISIRETYLSKAKDLVKTQNFDEATTLTLNETLDDLDTYVGTRINVNWWRRKCTVKDDTRVLGRLLWDSGLLSKEVFGLVVRVAGFKAPTLAYNECITHEKELRARIKEAPNMAPLLFRDFDLNSHQTVWKDLKDEFLSLGGTSLAWRWLCGQGQRWLLNFKMRAPEIAVINSIAALQIGKAPFHRGMYSSLVARADNWFTKGEGLPRFAEVFKAAVVAYKKRKLKVVEFQDHVLIFDYLEGMPTATAKGATWASLMRKQRGWHMENAQVQMERRKASGICREWAPMTPAVTMGELEAISLNTSEDLWEEGLVQRHCVGGYDEACFSNQSRIYSIRRDGQRVATLEVRRAGKSLESRQLYGRENTKVTDKKVIALARRTLSACRRAPPLNPAENKIRYAPSGSEAKAQQLLDELRQSPLLQDRFAA